MGIFERPFTPCAYDDCNALAVVRKDKKKLCLEHYEQEHLIVALKWNHDNGLDTDEKRQAYVFKNQFVMNKIL